MYKSHGKRIQTTGFYDFICYPLDAEETSFEFPISIQYGYLTQMYMATQSSLQPENSTSYSDVFDEFFYSNTENNKCLPMGSPGQGPNDYFNFFGADCIEWESNPVYCEDNLHNCDAAVKGFYRFKPT